MTRCLSLALLATMGGLLLLSGCSPSTRYPASLKYPLRRDVLAGGELKTDKEPTRLPPPGHLDESVQAALKETNTKSFDPAKLTREERGELRAALEELFGTPAAPGVRVALSAGDAGKLGVTTERGATVPFNDEKNLEKGSELYRKHCMHCHGVPGDGRGPTAAWVHPHPRDYRQGLFKFISSGGPGKPIMKPRLDDLRRTVQKGIDGTSMPAFGLLPAHEVDALVGYVAHLSIRGETEFQTMSLVLGKGDDRKASEGAVREVVNAEAEKAVKSWARANGDDGLNKPPEYPEKYVVKADTPAEELEAARAAVKKELDASVIRGHKLFNDPKGGGICITCHYDYGRQSAYRYDNWGTLVRPRDLTAGTYRGGRRPIDLYWRISTGISPSGMPAFNHTTAKVDEGAYWDLVNFVQALPYPHMLPADVRNQVYGTAQDAYDKAHKAGK